MSTATAELQGVMSVDDLQTTLEWSVLTERQRLWVLTYIASGGDQVLATRTAFDSSSPRRAAIYSYELLRNPKIESVLNLYLGRDDREAFISRLQRRIERRALSTAEIRALELLCKMKGWAEPENMPSGRGDERKTPRTVPVGCRPISRGGVVVGYLTPTEQRVDF